MPAVNGDERGYALSLVRSMAPEQVKDWASGSATDWADGSYGIARQMIYSPKPQDGETLPDGYAERMLPVVDQQLERAGVRLTAALVRALRGDAASQSSRTRDHEHEQ